MLWVEGETEGERAVPRGCILPSVLPPSHLPPTRWRAGSRGCFGVCGGFCFSVVTADGDDPPSGLPQVAAFFLRHEVKDAALGFAAEAGEEVLLDVDLERRLVVLVERTPSHLLDAPSSKLDAVVGEDGDERHARLDGGEVESLWLLGWVRHSCGLGASASMSRLSRAIAKRTASQAR